MSLSSGTLEVIALTFCLCLPNPVTAAAATIMLAFDLIMEPVAMMADFWNWAGDTIPFRNYAAWWVIAFLLAWLWGGTRSRSFRTNRAGGLLLLVQTAFFIGLLLLPWTS